MTLLAVGVFLFTVLPARTIAIVTDHQIVAVTTRLRDPERILREAGMPLGPKDSYRYAPDGRLLVERAIPVRVEADGMVYSFHTQSRTVAGVIQEAGISLYPEDRILVDGREAAPHVGLDQTFVGRLHGLAAPVLPQLVDQALPPVTVSVVRAVPFYLHDAGQTVRLASPAPTIGQALKEAGVSVGPYDKVQPDPAGPLQAGLHVYVHRAKRVLLSVDGSTRELFTHRQTVGELLQETGVSLRPQDRVSPSRDATLKPDMAVQVTRVDEKEEVQEEVIPGDVVYRDDPTLERGLTAVAEQGQDGLRRHRYRVRYENGVEVSRELLATETVREPKRTVILRGTKVPKTMTVWVTCYQLRGTTYTGHPVGYGVVAVDPNVIPLYTRMEIPGYGVGTALDTGSGVKGAWVDVWLPDCSGWATGYRTITILN